MSSDQRDVVIPITILVPASSRSPMEIELRHQALRMVVVDKDSVASLGDFWTRRGVYFLLGYGGDPDHYTAYVGKAPSGLISRVTNHVRTREDPWRRALLIASATSSGFDSAAIGWLEGRLYDLLEVASAAQILNRNRPRDESLPQYDREVLEQYVTPIAATLRALGYSPDTPDQQPPATLRRTRQTVSGSVSDLIRDGFVRAGTRLRSTRQDHEAVASVLSDGRLELDGEIFDSPSSAGERVLGHKVNGWDFWGAPSGDGSLTPLSTLRERLSDEGPRQAQPSLTPTVPQEVAAGTPLSQGPTGRRSPARSSISLADLIVAAPIPAQGVLTSHFRGGGHKAQYDASGRVEYEGQLYPTLSAAAVAATGKSTNGWEFWHVERDGGTVSLAAVRNELAR